MMKHIIEQLKKDNMETKKIILFLLIILGSSKIKTLAQNTCCELIKATNKIESHSLSSFKVEHSVSEDSIRFTFKNTTSDTIFLFKSYMDELLCSSKYLHRINKKNQTYTVSFSPIISNLTVKPSDKIILGENKVGSKYQLKYDFYIIPPSTYYIWKVSLGSIFKNKNERLNSIVSFNEKKVNKFSNYRFKSLTTSKLNGKFHLFFSFGFYTSVNIFCDCNSYYLNEFEFNRQAQSFNSAKIKVSIPKSKILPLCLQN